MEKFDDCYITAERKGKCCICGKLTNRIEYNYEAFICSRACEDVMNAELLNAKTEAFLQVSECKHIPI